MRTPSSAGPGDVEPDVLSLEPRPFPDSIPVSPSPRPISRSTIRRLSGYLRIVEKLEESGEATVSSRELSSRAGTSAPQVRKDLSSFGSFGKRGLGYPVERLRRALEKILGVDREWRVALVGAGRIGAALHAYPHFRDRGFDIVAILDADPAKIGVRWGGTEIRAIDELEGVLSGESIDMVILAAPAGPAPELARRVVNAGVSAILNFAPARLELPEDVIVNEVNLARELEILSFSLGRAHAGGADSERERR